ncbi:phytase [Aquimarina sp. 2201CG5-10]|uniref:phytase n=1 Tax=Aquimarina callyspongiae TaxID=3098150 RepID=UPI002AB4CD57|nr:phytase [Aquimarina sp. 2201CG5-10]MDY8135042.1 phytase [Aquimarina sp. 2201CG5-10]
MKNYILLTITILFFSCAKKLPVIAPDIISEKVQFDTDDPAIWLHPTDPSKSIVFGTDKDTNGAIYAFDLEGKIIKDKMIRGIKYPNNIDLEYGFKLNDSTTIDIIVFTERERNRIRVFSVPDMKPLDKGGFPVFEDETDIELRRPMGISLYKDAVNNNISAIVSRKSGPVTNYLYQYQIKSDSLGVHANFIRKFGKFSGVKEIEAIAIDDELGYVYYSDEGVGIRKYYANPAKGNEEISIFGGDYFKDDIEGIAITRKPNKEGVIIVSDQQKGQFNIFSRSDNSFIKAVNLGTEETDGCDVITAPLNTTFKRGLFVAMNDSQDFYFYDLGKIGL